MRRAYRALQVLLPLRQRKIRVRLCTGGGCSCRDSAIRPSSVAKLPPRRMSQLADQTPTEEAVSPESVLPSIRCALQGSLPREFRRGNQV